MFFLSSLEKEYQDTCGDSNFEALGFAFIIAPQLSKLASEMEGIFDGFV